MKLLSLDSTEPRNGAIRLHGREAAYVSRFETARFEGGAQITAFSYLADSGNRPVVFITNGGPGSSSVWLHLGLFGPRRIHLDDPVLPPTVPPYRLEDNPHCLLDCCDLVLMDPPGAGLSAEPDETTSAEFYSVDGDALAFALFIEKWLQVHGRTNSPLYFIGESYGTLRAPALCDALMGGPFSAQKRQVSISLSGVGCLGTAFTTSASMLQKPSIEESILNLPCCAATAAYFYPQRFASPAEAADEAWKYASVYLDALFRGRALPEDAQQEVAAQIEHFTNIPASVLRENRLRFTMEQFRNTVLPGKSVGAYDGRYTMDGPGVPGNSPYPGMTDPVAEDPAMGRYTPSFVGGMNLLREELGLPDGIYKAINFDVNARWNYQSSRPPVGSLENAMRRNPSMRLFFGTGLYDLVTVAGSVRYTLANSGLPLDRVMAVEYESGHMPYLGEASARKLEEDLRRFLI